MVPLPRKRRGLPRVPASSRGPAGVPRDGISPLVRSRGAATHTDRRPVLAVLVDSANPGECGPPPSGQDIGRVYRPRPKDTVLNRYLVDSAIGQGSFGTVVKAADKFTGTLVAVKILHKDEDSGADGAREVEVYRKLLAGCSRHSEFFAAVIGTGVHRGFNCIVFEMCQCTLHDVIKENSGLLPLPGRHVLEIAYQLVKGIDYLHSMGIVHADIKPDNIALRSSDTVAVSWLDPLTGFHPKNILTSCQICILDLGMAVDTQVNPTALSGRVGNRAYRAPEISLGLPWSFSLDAFAIGCVISELYLGGPLFPSGIDSDREHLAVVEKIVGPFPSSYASRIESKMPGTFAFNPVSVVFPPRESSVSVGSLTDPMKRVEQAAPLAGRIHDVVLHDLLHHIMTPDPNSRLALEAAAKHKYFDGLSRLYLQ